MGITVTPLTGPALVTALDDLARLRMSVFRAYPYLYEGALEYELEYLRAFQTGKDGIIVVAKDGDRVVGCATGSALATHHERLLEPLKRTGYDIGTMFYCGESVLSPHYRGQGIGHAFFDHREAFARARGYSKSAFCAVVRPDDHPERPPDYSPLDAFWQKRGYRKMNGVMAHFPWREIGSDRQTEKTMQFWMKDLS